MQSNPTVPQSPPDITPTQEVRFAVVMYGGLSLAIYMNGVAQELLRLVRATAPAERLSRKAGAEPCESTEAVYRTLGRMLRRGQDPLVEVNPDGSIKEPDGPILTRFIVDVISGTSAGGINGVFLAKALANRQGMEQLKQLWINVGDFAELLVDRRWGLAPKPQS